MKQIQRPVAWFQAIIARLQTTVPGQMYERFVQGEGNIFAPMIAYTAMLSMFPIMLSLLTLLSALFGDPVASEQFQSAFLSTFPGEIARDASEVLRQAHQGVGLLGVLSFIGLLWGGSALFGALEMGFSRIYGVPSRDFLWQRLMAVSMIFVFAVLLVLSIATSSLAQAAITFSTDRAAINEWASPIATGVSWVLSFGLSWLMFTVVYRVVPNVRLEADEVWPGSLLATLIYVLMLQVFPLFVRYLAGFNLYGAVFGFLFMLLTWLYLLALVLLLGACLNAVLHPARAKPAEAP
jgi:membrane protein